MLNSVFIVANNVWSFYSMFLRLLAEKYSLIHAAYIDKLLKNLLKIYIFIRNKSLKQTNF